MVKTDSECESERCLYILCTKKKCFPSSSSIVLNFSSFPSATAFQHVARSALAVADMRMADLHEKIFALTKCNLITAVEQVSHPFLYVIEVVSLWRGFTESCLYHYLCYLQVHFASTSDIFTPPFSRVCTSTMGAAGEFRGERKLQLQPSVSGGIDWISGSGCWVLWDGASNQQQCCPSRGDFLSE